MKTILHIELPVNKRKKPDDYHYANDDEVISLRDRVTELEQLVQNGDSIYVKKGDQNSGTSCNYTASATGSMSFASGTLTKSSGSNSLTSGSESIASATNAVAFGEKNVASGINSSAHGESTQAQSDNSATFGYKTTTNGYAAFAEGINTQAISPGSHAAGEGTIASGVSNQFVIGQYNEKDEDGKYLFIIGNGTYDNSTKEETRENVFVVGKNGSIAGGNGCVANGENSVAFGEGNRAYSKDSFIVGTSNITGIQPTDDNPNPTEPPYSVAIGVNCTASGYQAFAIGTGCKASGNSTSFAIGSSCSASGDFSYAIGGGVNVKADYSFGFGGGITIESEAKSSIALMSGTRVYSPSSMAIGSGSIAGIIPSSNTSDVIIQKQGCFSLGFGCHSTGGNGSLATGYGTNSYSESQFVAGKYNIEDANDKYGFVLGNGTTTTRSNAIAIDWQGKIYVNNSDTGVDVLDLLNRVKALETALDGLKLKKTTTSEYDSLESKDNNTVYFCTE